MSPLQIRCSHDWLAVTRHLLVLHVHHVDRVFFDDKVELSRVVQFQNRLAQRNPLDHLGRLVVPNEHFVRPELNITRCRNQQEYIRHIQHLAQFEPARELPFARKLELGQDLVDPEAGTSCERTKLASRVKAE